jgi:signal transduction histidine kinase
MTVNLPPTTPPASDLIALNPQVRENAGALLSALLQATDYGILLSGLDGQDIVANRRFGELFELAPAAIVVMDPGAVRDLARSRFRDETAFEAVIRRAYADPELTWEDELELAGEPWRTVRRFTAPVRGPSGEPIGRLWTFLDITETKRLQAQVQSQLAARTRDFLETSDVLRLMNDLCLQALARGEPDELLAAVAQRLRSLPGYAGAAVLLYNAEEGVFQGTCCAAGRPPRPAALAAGADPALAACLDPVGDNPLVRAEPTGALAALLQAGSVTVAPLQSGGRIAGVLALAADAPSAGGAAPGTAHLGAVVDQLALALEAYRLRAELESTLVDLRAAQRQMVEMERLRTAGAIAASIAQDIRNILTPLQVELAAHPPAAALQGQLNRFLALAHQLLAFSRPRLLDFQPTSLPEIVARVVAWVAGQAELGGVAIRCEFSPDLPPVAADTRQLEHLFVNLCFNAVQAMAEGGGTLTLTGRADGDWVEVAVIDTGNGIAAEDVERVFEPFFTRRANGLGLGLFSCKRIAEDHGGTLRVDSAPGAGACFTLRLPAGGRREDSDAAPAAG